MTQISYNEFTECVVHNVSVLDKLRGGGEIETRGLY